MPKHYWKYVLWNEVSIQLPIYMLHLTFFVYYLEPLLVTKIINFTPRYIVTLLGHMTSSVV